MIIVNYPSRLRVYFFFWPVLGKYGRNCLNMVGVNMLPYMVGYWGCTGSDITNDITDTL